ncbi:CotS family spore coat protein [Clostridium polynesiense]|uniref:CotS family spore coat protein n=1 Tax=Clostridium polynesiense TaxID=1325933 RepID=UPI00058D32B4|nr:CotS family spore coat protein [Clostridium polynesiense]
MDTKYIDKKNLCYYDLDVRLFRKFNLEVFDIVPLRSIFILHTEEGKKILKRLDFPISRLKFIVKALNFISSKFNRIISFETAADGELYVLWEDSLYVLLNVVEGRECQVTNPVDIQLAASALGEMHAASHGIFEFFQRDTVDGAGDNITLFKYPEVLEKSRAMLKDIKLQVSKYRYKSEMDEMFLKEADFNIEELNECISLMEECSYKSICGDVDKISLCHNDLAHHNILIHEEKAFLLDFDFSTIDLKIKDLSNLIIKSIKNYDYNMEIAKNIIKEYSKYHAISKDEFKVMYIMLKFPEDFVSITRNYYLKQKDWEEEVFINRFRKKIEYTPSKMSFLKEFKELFLK